MDQYTKDLIDAISKSVGVLSVFAAIFVAYFQVRKNREERQIQAEKDRAQREKELEEATSSRQQREEELRWRKASLAREILKELWGDPYSADAMNMLDWSNREYKIKQDVTSKITREEMWVALRIMRLDFDDKEKYVRDCFDTFFGKMQTTEHYIRINLLLFEDVEYPFNYFAGQLARRRDVIESFLNKYEYDKALAFLNRLSNWNTTATPGQIPVQL